MARRSSIMMQNTTNKFEVIGDPVRADSYYGFTDGLHTISVHYHNFTGRFRIQGTLALEPEESDWFDIDLQAIECDGVSYVEYPRDPENPTTSDASGFVGDTGVDAFTFVGNFTFLRARMDRAYLGDINITETSLGTIDKVLLSL